MEIKELLYKACLEQLASRLNTIRKNIDTVREALTSETKSSAGDKHETGRAMLQLEREKLGSQLAEINKEREILFKIDIKKASNIIGLGSIIYTTQSNYFIATSSGELKLNKDFFFAISPNTPIGKLLIGKKVKDEVHFREQQFSIIKVL